MHIGFLTPEYPDVHKHTGGLANYIRKIAIELAHRGHRATVFVLSNENKYWEDEGTTIYQIKEFRFHWRFKKNRFLSIYLPLVEQLINSERLKHFVLQTHRKVPLDILQTSDFRFPGYALCKNGLIPLVCRCSYYRPILYAANGRRRIFREMLEDWLESSIALNADATFAPSQFVANLFEKFEAFHPEVIHTPLNLPTLTFDDTVYFKFLEGKRYLLFFGTLMGVKGVDVLIRALPPLLEKHADLFIAFIGENGPIPGNETALDLIHKMLAVYGNQVFYHPSLSRSQLYPIICNSIGVVLPSRADNYPNACLEALALGIPVIGTYESSLEEIIVDGKTGFLARNNDPQSLYQMIECLVNLDESKRGQMKDNIREAVSTFEKEDRVGQLIKFYQNAISKFEKF